MSALPLELRVLGALMAARAWAAIGEEPGACSQEAKAVLRQAQDEPVLNEDSVAARAVADRPAIAVPADGVACDASTGGTASPVLAETPAAAAAADLSRSQASAEVAGEPLRGTARREFMARATLAALTEAADAGAPCPKNTALSVVIQGSYTEVPAVLARLKEAGLISVAKDGKRRKVTILATGRATDWSLPDERVATAEARHLIDAKQAEAAAIAERRAATERAQAERRAELRERALAAEQVGKVPAAIGLQAVALADRAASVSRALQDAWPDTWRLLVRLSCAQSERPLVLIDRLIREEAARVGVKTPPTRRAPDDEDDEDDGAVMDAAMVDAAGDDGPRDVLDEGNWQ